MEAIEIRNAVDGILAKAGVTFSVRLIGETKRDDWTCDEWRVKFGKWETSYYTGTGHRKPIKGAPADKGSPNTLFREQWERIYLRPHAPKAADVLYSLVLDSSAGDASFQDWCADFGYSDDSLSALDTYRACCAIATKLRATFKPDVLAAIREAVQEL